MAAISCEVLDTRLTKLENRIFGTLDKDAIYAKVTDTLAGINTKINSTISGKPKVENVMKQLAYLEKCLEPSYLEEMGLDRDAKLEIILAEENLIRQQAANLEKVTELTEVLGSEHIKAAPSFENRLTSLGKLTLVQQDETAELAEELKNLLAQYNSIMTLLSKQFVQWDAKVTELELASCKKKTPN